MLAKRTRRAVVWLALAAMLFSALSPAMASALFADQPHVLARMLGLPAPDQAVGEICHTDATETTITKKDGADPDAGSRHTSHGIYCSFCLAVSSHVSLPPVVTTELAILHTAREPLPALRAQRVLSFAPVTLHSRGPPALPLTR